MDSSLEREALLRRLERAAERLREFDRHGAPRVVLMAELANIRGLCDGYESLAELR